MRSAADRILGFLIRFLHEGLGMSPNQISTAGFVAGLAAAGAVIAGSLPGGLALMAVAQILDGLDGGVARRYNLGSKTGLVLEIVYDRLSELVMFVALAWAGLVTPGMVALAFSAILLITLTERYTGFDPGFKRFMLYFGYLVTVIFHVPGFQIAMHVIFLANLAGILIGTVLADYRLQQAVDEQELIRREAERRMGLPQPPDDPPSFLSKLFS
jgi:phosphatidylglycerophosphate synthase